MPLWPNHYISGKISVEMKRISVFLMLVVLANCESKAQSFSENMMQLVEWMTGEFDSSEQANADTAFYNISLKMTRIWHNQPNGIWLYVEQAVAETPEKPYRQRIYFLSETNDDEFTSDVYLIPEEVNYIGAWKTPGAFDNLTPFNLNYKSGCAVFLFYDGFQYGGKTNEKSCKSDMRGAAYATSEVVLTATEIHTWDRGMNVDGKQVWGSESGHYIFKKK
jgi:hypothetical protein